MAVSRFGSSSDCATRYALDKYGLVPQTNVTILEIGSQPARFAALEAGKVNAVMMSVSLTAKAKAAGFRSLADLQMLGLEYQHTGLARIQGLISSQPDLVQSSGRLPQIRDVNDLLIAQLKRGGTSAQLIDDAPFLSENALENLHLHSNLETGTQKLL